VGKKSDKKPEQKVPQVDSMSQKPAEQKPAEQAKLRLPPDLVGEVTSKYMKIGDFVLRREYWRSVYDAMMQGTGLKEGQSLRVFIKARAIPQPPVKKPFTEREGWKRALRALDELSKLGKI